MPTVARTDPLHWTYGAEHELSDWDCSVSLPAGYKRAPDYTIVNSNGIAAQVDTSLYGFGGEINTPPTKSCEEQSRCLDTVLSVCKGSTVNYRSNLHVHIRVPGLAGDLRLLKQIQHYIHFELRPHIDEVDPIPHGETLYERRREKRMYVSHHSFMEDRVLLDQMNARTVQEFFEAEAPKDDAGRPLYHLRPRCCVNLRQLLQTDTIEFRHFFGTVSSTELLRCIEWCRDFLVCAIAGVGLSIPVAAYKKRGGFPQCQPFSEEMEIGYQATSCHSNKREDIVRAIGLIQSGRFVGSSDYEYAAARARGEEYTEDYVPLQCTRLV